MVSVHHAAQLFQAMPEGLLVNAGGHQAAGGFSIAKEKVHFLEAELNAALARSEKDEVGKIVEAMNAIPSSLAIATARHYEVIRRFAPFGVGNCEPEFLFEQLIVTSTKKFGKSKEHLECIVTDETGTATAFTFFASPSIEEKITVGSPVAFTATIEPGWRSGMRLRIKDVL